MVMFNSYVKLPEGRLLSVRRRPCPMHLTGHGQNKREEGEAAGNRCQHTSHVHARWKAGHQEASWCYLMEIKTHIDTLIIWSKHMLKSNRWVAEKTKCFFAILCPIFKSYCRNIIKHGQYMLILCVVLWFEKHICYPLVNQRHYGTSPCLISKSTINGNFQSLCYYVSLPDGIICFCVHTTF